MIEDPLFTCSHWRNLCQIADIIAYVINYKFQNRKLKDPKKHKAIENAYEIIDKKIIRKGDSISYSLKVFPE